jgi:hypothetical protein
VFKNLWKNLNLIKIMIFQWNYLLGKINKYLKSIRNFSEKNVADKVKKIHCSKLVENENRVLHAGGQENVNRL